jgi:hypothetical protein
MIRWINCYPAIPGLGNLHGRLAYNQSFFTYVAVLNFYPFFGYGRSLANSFLLLLLLAMVFPSMVAVIRCPTLLVKTHTFKYTSDIFVIPLIVYLSLSSNGVASPSPDLASSLLQIAMYIVLSHGIAEWDEGKQRQDYRVMLLVVLAATAGTIKLSNLAFSGAIIILSLAYAWYSTGSCRKVVPSLLVPVIAVMLVWLIRGFIFSGAPLYPSTIGYLPAAWAMPKQEIIREANWIYSWARQPGAYWGNVIGRWTWIGPWLRRMLHHKIDMLFPLLLTIVFSFAAITGDRKMKGRQPHLLEWAILLPSLVGMGYWFVTAPDPRFANAIFFIAAISSTLLFLLRKREILSIKMIGVILLLGNMHFIAYAYINRGQVGVISTSGWQKVNEIPMDEKITSSGLMVYTPHKGDQCWDSPLPSTPYFNDKLRLRDPSRMDRGFAVKDIGKHAEGQ